MVNFSVKNKSRKWENFAIQIFREDEGKIGDFAIKIEEVEEKWGIFTIGKEEKKNTEKLKFEKKEKEEKKLENFFIKKERKRRNFYIRKKENWVNFLFFKKKRRLP